jgi:hypothetical protein
MMKTVYVCNVTKKQYKFSNVYCLTLFLLFDHENFIGNYEIRSFDQFETQH